MIVAVGLWLWLDQPVSNAPADEALLEEGAATSLQGNVVVEDDNTASINQDLDKVDVLDPDFNSIDSDLNSL